MRAVVVIAVLGGCSFPEYTLIDGQGTPFGCAGAPAPTTADNPIVFSGTVVQSTTVMPINNAAVVGQIGATQAFTTNTDATGKFSKSLNSGNAPLEIDLAVSANGFLNTYYYPAHLVTHDAHYDVELFSQADANMLAAAAQVTLDPAKGTILMTIDDCNGAPLRGAMVTSTIPAGATVRYFDRVTPSAVATSTDMYGVAMIANLPPGNFLLNAKSADSMALKTRPVQIVANAFIQTQIQP